MTWFFFFFFRFVQECCSIHWIFWEHVLFCESSVGKWAVWVDLSDLSFILSFCATLAHKERKREPWNTNYHIHRSTHAVCLDHNPVWTPPGSFLRFEYSLLVLDSLPPSRPSGFKMPTTDGWKKRTNTTLKWSCLQTICFEGKDWFTSVKLWQFHHFYGHYSLSRRA